MCAVPEQIIDTTPVCVNNSVDINACVNCHKTQAYILNFMKVVAHYRTNLIIGA